MGHFSRKLQALFAFTVYSLACAPGAGAWILCASGSEAAVESSLSSCCIAKHSAANQETAHVSPDPGCTDTPIVVPAHFGSSDCSKLSPSQVPGNLPLPAQLSLTTIQPPSAQMSWAQSLAPEDPLAVKTVVLLC